MQRAVGKHAQLQYCSCTWVYRIQQFSTVLYLDRPFSQPHDTPRQWGPTEETCPPIRQPSDTVIDSRRRPRHLLRLGEGTLEPRDCPIFRALGTRHSVPRSSPRALPRHRVRSAPALCVPLHSHDRRTRCCLLHSLWQDGSLCACIAYSFGDRRGRLKSAKIKSGLLPEFGVCSDLCAAVCPLHDSAGRQSGVLLGRGCDATTAPGAALESGGYGPGSILPLRRRSWCAAARHAPFLTPILPNPPCSNAAMHACPSSAAPLLTAAARHPRRRCRRGWRSRCDRARGGRLRRLRRSPRCRRPARCRRCRRPWLLHAHAWAGPLPHGCCGRTALGGLALRFLERI